MQFNTPLLFLIVLRIGILDCHNVPCTFNTMCLCWVQDDTEYTKMDISCMGVPFARFPEISVSYVAQLDIVGSGMQILENDALAGSSVEAFGLMSNRLTSIADKSLLGVAESLRSLDLSYNTLEEIPFRAFQSLRRLNWLNMHSNHLTTLEGDWGHVRNTLASAFFGDNFINEIPKSFENFKSLVWFNLDNNNLQMIRESCLPPSIHTLSLNNNLLKSFPTSLGDLPALNWLYLRGNNIRHLELPIFRNPNVELLDLSENFIESIASPSYSNYTMHVRDFNLASNKLSKLPADMFTGLRVRRIHLSSNGIQSVDKNTFRGLEESLEYLNLENNELSVVPEAIEGMERISYLYLANNNIGNMTSENFREFAEILKALSVATNNLRQVPVNALERCQQLLHLNLGYNKIQSIEPGEFEWAESLEILLLRNNLITKLKSKTFKGASELKELSLSFNHITELDDDAFLGIETLEILELSFAFATDIFPRLAIKPLTNLLWLVLDNNNFQTVDASAFYSLQKLRYLNLESNRLHYIPEQVFLSSIHSELRDVKLGYNFLESIPQDTFHKLTELRSLDFTGNRIHVIPAKCIWDCPKLLTLSLAYNKITRMEKKAFQQLNNLQFLHLEFNKLSVLDLESISDSGCSDFSLNVSYNAISTINPGSINNLTHLDLAFNNITHLVMDVFKGTPNLRTIDLRNNRLMSLEPDTFALARLESLNLRSNRLKSIRKQAFNGLERLQQLDLAGNDINQLAMEQFRYLKNLRVLDLSRNEIRSLLQNVFEGTRVEILDLSHNRLTAVPSLAFAELGYTLRDLNLADNLIDHLDSTAFPTSLLTSLNLARNRITILPDNSFVALGKLLVLNMTHNSLQANFKELFHYLPDLRQLYLAKCTLRKIPVLPLNQLTFLDVSSNNMHSISDSDFQYLDQLKVLRLVNNSLSAVPILKLNFLRELDISGNAIEELTKESFSGFPRLDRLNLKNLNKMKSVDKDSLRELYYLKHLQIQTWPQADGFHLRYLLSDLPLRTVEIQVSEHLLKYQIQNVFSKHIKELTITGHDLETISSEAFSSIEGGDFILRIRDTRVQRFQSDIFLSLTKRLSQLTLDLRDNNINELSPSIIYGNLSWEAVGTNMVAGGLQVSGNPLECDCEIAWLSLWLRRWLRESRQIHTASQSDARQLRSIAGRAVCTETTTSYSSDKVLLTLGTPHTACQASALSSASYGFYPVSFLYIVVVFLLSQVLSTLPSKVGSQRILATNG
ncbi:chaoptin [Cephus cinctus]|uniref:Chaoptin n=1 Tax=Cephus cinctus TaxID=211228 RepID=A0AAJ7BVI2_CEPCN|nr:chaoptin [Cephus cinctus]